MVFFQLLDPLDFSILSNLLPAIKSLVFSSIRSQLHSLAMGTRITYLFSWLRYLNNTHTLQSNISDETWLNYSQLPTFTKACRYSLTKSKCVRPYFGPPFYSQTCQFSLILLVLCSCLWMRTLLIFLYAWQWIRSGGWPEYK